MGTINLPEDGHPFTVEPEAIFETARAAVRAQLPLVDTLTDEGCRRAIRRYTAGVGPNFVPWLAAGAICCRSLEGRHVTAENAYIEIRDDHAGMLREFARLCSAEPETEDYRYAEQQALPVQSEISKMSGMFIVALAGTLENTSLEFIPWLGAVSERLGNTDMSYIAVHGEADLEHAKQLQLALTQEAAFHEAPEEAINSGVALGVAFITSLLRP